MPFDRFLNGETDAISTEAKRGYERFKALGCISCHQGANVGGNMFQTFGVFGDYLKTRGQLSKVDHGRFNITGLPEDEHKFKVPGLRLVSRTAPYFHDGSVKALPEAVRIMARYQLGRSISEEDVRLIVTFLKSLAGNLYGNSQK